jgi:hypothetical protein
MRETMIIIKATTEKEIPLILDYVHDRDYDIDQVVLSEESGELTIPVSLGNIEEKGILKIKGASSFTISDQAEIEIGDINTIRYKEGNVVVKGCLPVDIYINVSRLEIELSLPPNAPLA